jgi:antitoxin component of MazEF toxin-antitoxin module
VVDPFVVIMVGLVGGLLVALILLGLFYPGSGADQVNWRQTRSVETEVQNEIDDLDQMLEAANVKRRARGARELTQEHMHERVAEDRRLADEQREAYLGEVEIEQMLAVKNERRARKGLEPITAEQYRAELEAERGRL